MTQTMLVVGSAPCLFEDVEAALNLRPFAAIMLVNGACNALENAEHMLCGHEEKSEYFVAARKKAFPNAAPIRVHGCSHPHRLKMAKQMFPSVTDWHNHEIGVGATSASKAAKIGFLLGFNEIILCGCPMDQPGYFPGEADVPQHVQCARIGDHNTTKHFVTPSRGAGWNYSTEPGMPMKVQEMKIIKSYRTNLKILAHGEFKDKVYSMSGFTRDCLGLPPAA